jgi:hypothetical protein
MEKAMHANHAQSSCPALGRASTSSQQAVEDKTWMAGTSPAMTKDTDETRVLRAASDMLHLHGLCGRRACRRARSCRGEPRGCLTRYAPLVPEDARDGAQAMVEGWQQGFSFDELMDDARHEVLALVAWADAVAASYRRLRPTVRQGRAVSAPR